MIHELRREQRLPLAKEELFPFFCDARNLARITPPELAFRFETQPPLPSEMKVGAEIAYRLRLWGVPFRWRTRITAWDPPHGFARAGRRGRALRGAATRIFDYRRQAVAERFGGVASLSRPT